MDEFVKTARKQLEDLEIEKMLKDVDLSKISLEQLKSIDFREGAESARKQLQQLDMRKREEDAANEGFLGGVILGAILGAIIALIFAPKSGSETRELAAAQVADLKHKASDAVSSANSNEDVEVQVNLPSEPAIERVIGE